MAYQVLARKYRPQTFAEVVGQDHITTTLGNALVAGRLHHAYLFVGVRGTGKTTVARILARALNCQERRGAEPCGSCGPCREIAGGASLDVQEIDGASNTSVDDVRELREQTKFLPAAGRYRIYIIDEVHMLSGSAFNALLKTLEEPPAHVVFIFATTEAHKIPATILSRCQRYDFRRIPAPLIAATLSRIATEERVDAEAGALALIAREATGSLRDAESLLDQAIAFSGDRVTAETIQGMLGFLDRQRLFDLVGALLARDPKRALSELEAVAAAGADMNRFAGDVLELLRHLLVLAECGEERGSVDLIADELARLRALLPQGKAAELHQMFSLWYRTVEESARSSFPKMLLEVGLIRLCRVGSVLPLDEIVAKLDAVLEGEPLAPVRATTPVPATSVDVISMDKKPMVPPRAASAKESAPAAVPAAPAFEAVASPADVDAERRWQEFMRWLVGERPQLSSLFQHGVIVGIDDGVVKVMFDNPLYADMLSEEERRLQVEALFLTFFKRPMRLAVGKSGEVPPAGVRGERKKELMREALGSEIVRKAADIFGATVHDVKVDGEK